MRRLHSEGRYLERKSRREEEEDEEEEEIDET
jgi:hypothetical protein